MVLVHLYYEKVQFGPTLGPLLGEYTRFAAGGFVFVAGLAIGAIFLPKARLPQRRWETFRRLWRRSLRVLGWQYLVAIAWVGLGVYRGNHDPVTSYDRLLIDVVTFREGGDLLPLYVLLIALAPLLLACCLRAWGRFWLALASIGIFIFGRFHPYALAFDPQGNFPPLLWQIVFIAGMLAGSALGRYDRLSVKTKLGMAAGAWMAFALLFWCEYWRQFGMPACPVKLVFTKVPLTTAEMLRYLSAICGIIITTDLAWAWIAQTRFAAFSATLGRSTLPVYVAHTFLIELAGYLAATWWWMGTWQLMSIPISLILLWLLAIAIQWRGQPTSLASDLSIWFGSRQAGQIGE